MNTNLLSETLEVLTGCDKTPDDVRFVTDGLRSCSFEEFRSAAANIEYYAGYGRNIISITLMIVGKGWWLERGEYDGSEWWNFKEVPKRPRRGVVHIGGTYDETFRTS